MPRPRPALPPRVLLGAAYYHEYMPAPRLSVDLDLMEAARFSVIRVGESVWSTWEPEDGVFDLDWLQPVLDGAHERGIAVIIGTPSYAVPPWLRRKYPETTAQRRTGQPIPYGGRQDADFAHPAFRHLVERLVRRIVSRYAAHPAVIGWQVDNEPGLELLHGPAAFEGFIDHLRARHGDVAALNERWGLTYWSHRLSRWDELWPPEGNTDPPYALAWRRYQAGLTADFVAWQARIVRELAREDQFVTTCLAMDRPALDNVRTTAPLDVTAVNIYHPMQDTLALPVPVELPEMRPEWLSSAGTWTLFWGADLARGIRDEPFLITETGATTIGEHSVNYPAFDGQWRQAAWTFVSRGARMIEYWHWHTIHFGNEAHWGGILGHSLEPGRCYAEVATIGSELERAGERVVDLVPDEPVALLVSPDSRWALEHQPPLVRPGTSTPDRGAYGRIVTSFYRGLFETGIGTSLVHPDRLADDTGALVRRWPVLVAAALYVASDLLLGRLASYAREGGHLVLTFRTGYADEEGRIRPAVMPGPLREAVGAHYLESTNLARPVALRPAAGEGGPLGSGHATGWADGLVAEAASVLLTYDHPHLGRWPAVTTHPYGQGRVTYVGTLPDAVLARSLATWIASSSLRADPWRMAGGSVTSYGATAPDGTRLRFLANWSWAAQDVTVPVDVHDILSGERVGEGASVALGAWDVRVLCEDG